MEKYYYVFGTEAAILYEDGFDTLLEAAKEGIDFHLFVYDAHMHPNTLLNVARGEQAYIELSEDEYDSLINA